MRILWVEEELGIIALKGTIFLLNFQKIFG